MIDTQSTVPAPHEPAARVLAAADLVTGCTRIAKIDLTGVELSDGARQVLGVAQDAQDGAASWGHALTSAFTAAIDAGLLGDDDIADLTEHLAAALPVKEAS